MAAEDTSLIVESGRALRQGSANDARELFARALAAAEPALRAMPAAARQGAIKELHAAAVRRTERSALKTAAGLAAMPVGAAVAGIRTLNPYLDTGVDRFGLPLPGEDERESAPERVKRALREQRQYEATVDPPERDSQGFAENAKQGASDFWNAIPRLPQMIAEKAIEGPEAGYGFGEQMGEAIVRDTTYLATDPGRALHNDPTRALDIMPASKAAGSAAKAAKHAIHSPALLKRLRGAPTLADKARNIAGHGAEVVGEFLDPTPDHVRAISRERKPVGTEAAARANKAIDEALASGSMDPIQAAHARERLRAERTIVTELGEDMVSPVGRAAGAAGKVARRALIAGALGADALGAGPAAVVGAVGGHLVGKGAQWLASRSAHKDGVVLTPDEAKAAVTRRIIDANAQANPADAMAVADTTRDPLHQQLAIRTTASPIAQAIRDGQLRAGAIDESLSPAEQAARQKEFPVESRFMEYQDGALVASGEAADVARKGEHEAIASGALAGIAKIENRTARRKLEDATRGLEPDEVKAVRETVKAGNKATEKTAEFEKAQSALSEMEPSTKAKLLEEARVAQKGLDKLSEQIAANDRELRAADAAAGNKKRPTTAAQVKKLAKARKEQERAVARIEALEARAKAAGPEVYAEFQRARELATASAQADLRLSTAIKRKGKGGAAAARKAISDYSAARSRASKSVAEEDLANRMKASAKAAAESWSEGRPVTTEVLLGLAIIRDEVRAAGSTLLKQSKDLHGLDKSRGAGGWNLREARRENRVRDQARALDKTLARAVNDLDDLEAKAALVPERLAADVERGLEAREALEAVSARPRLLGEKVAEAAIKADRAAAEEGLLLRRPSVSDTDAAAAALREAKARAKAVGRASSDDRKYVRLARFTDSIKEQLTTLLEKFRRGLIENDFAAGEIVSAVAAKDARKSLVQAAAKAARERKKSLSGLEAKGKRVFQRPEADGALAPEAVAAARGIIAILGDSPEAFARVEDILIRSVNRQSMIHALNPRVVGRISKDFARSLAEQGITAEVVAATDAFKRSPFASKGAAIQMAPLGGLKARVDKFLERVIQDVIVEQVQPSVVGGGKGDVLRSAEVRPVISMPDGSVFDVGEAVMRALSELEGEGKVTAAELMAGAAEAAFHNLSQQHLERKTTEAIGAEVARGQSLVLDAKGNVGGPLTQFGIFAAAGADGARPNIVLFDVTPGSDDAAKAFGRAGFETVAETTEMATGVKLTPQQIAAAQKDLSDNFMPAPESIETAVRQSLSERGVKIPSDTKISVRYGYGQSVGVHLDYLQAMRDTEVGVGKMLRGIKRGLTVGSTAALLMNALSNLTLTSVMQGRTTAQTTASWANELRLMVDFERNKGASILTTEGRITRALLGTGIADSSIVRDFSGLAVGGQSTKLPFQRGWDLYWDARTSAYKQIDAIPKMALAREQMKAILEDLDKLGVGKTISLDIGAGNRALIYRDNAGQLRLNGKIVEQSKIDDAVAKQATRASAAALFDFNESGIIFKTMFKGRAPGVVNELGSWFAKALEMPGRQGIFSTAALFDPRSAYLTNDPKLLANKAAAFTGLMVRRAALHASARAVRDENERLMGKTFGYSRGPMTITSRHADDDSGYDVNVADLSSSSWMEAALLQAESAASGAGLIRDLLMEKLGAFSERGRAAAEIIARAGNRDDPGRRYLSYEGLSPQEKQEAQVLDRHIGEIVHSATGDRDFIGSILSMAQVTGGLFNRATKLDDMTAGKGAEFILQMFAGRDIATLLAQPAARRADPDNRDALKATTRDESKIRFALSGLFRAIGREKNSEAAIQSRLNSLKKEVSRRYRDKSIDEATKAFVFWVLDSEADKAREAVKAILEGR